MPDLSGYGQSISSANQARPNLANFREAHGRADAFCREVQGFVEELGIPAVNEMRYAGYHLLAALTDDGSLASPDELTKAINHANRACYEASEAGILYALDQISIFKDDYSTVVIGETVPAYHAILRDADTALAKVTQERSYGDDRLADHCDLMEKFKLLKAHCETSDLGRDEMNKRVRKDSQDGRRFVVGTIIAAGILLAAIFGILLSLHK